MPSTRLVPVEKCGAENSSWKHDPEIFRPTFFDKLFTGRDRDLNRDRKYFAATSVAATFGLAPNVAIGLAFKLSVLTDRAVLRSWPSGPRTRSYKGAVC